jgi:UDP-N-acetylglucosamine 4,6-dehydratase/5-epimerase
VSQASELIRDRTVLITGGTGSIGSAITRAVLAMRPRALRVLSRDDTKQFELQHQLEHDPALRMLIGDVRDRDRMRRAMAGVDIVFHAAALKHVPACEFNPFEASETNVRGTQNVVEAAIDSGVDRVLAVSTDKAVDPTNVMGATKLLSERLVSAAEVAKGPAKTSFASVRFGNVIGSRGSLIPLIRRQVARGGPVTITDPEMTRYVMPISKAVDLCFEAVDRMQGGEVFILKMPRVRVGDLVQLLIAEYAPQSGLRPSDILVEVIGSRQGEKKHEVLMTEDEAGRALELVDMYVVGATPGADGAVTGGRANEPCLSSAELRDLLHEAGWLDARHAPEY